MADFRLDTPRLTLRAWLPGDEEHAWAMAQDPEVMRYLPALSRAESDAMVARMVAMQAEHGMTFWVTERRADGAFLGMCGLCPPRAPLSEHEIGWRLARHAWGQGYGQEAARAALGWAFARLPIASIVAITVPANTRSRALMARIGMTHMPDEAFDHPGQPAGSPLSRHVLYRIHRETA